MKIITLLPLFMMMVVMGCQKERTPAQPDAKATNGRDFVGCYTIKQDTPAQIKVSKEADHYVMQMKEPKGAGRVWDNPEPLEMLDIDEAWTFFAVNHLDLNKSDVEAVIARPDKMMALAKVKDSVKNINPHLDSAHVVYIFKGSNTIYQVACDETPLDIIKPVH